MNYLACTRSSKKGNGKQTIYTFHQHLSSWISCILLMAWPWTDPLNLTLKIIALEYWHLEIHFAGPGYAPYSTLLTDYGSCSFKSVPPCPPISALRAHTDTSLTPWSIAKMGPIRQMEESHKHCKTWSSGQNEVMLTICFSPPFWILSSGSTSGAQYFGLRLFKSHRFLFLAFSSPCCFSVWL